MTSVLKDGLIIPPTHFEIIVADHCNLTCRQCNHLSPMVRKWNATAEEIGKSLEILSKIYRPYSAKIIGGEPLLNPNLAEIVNQVRASGFSDRVTLVTNGMLLERASDALLSLFTTIELSNYPGAGFVEQDFEAIKKRLDRLGVAFTLSNFTYFRRTFSNQKNEDEQLVDDIFRACKIAHVWGCHALYRGRLYRCPQSIYIPLLNKDLDNESIEITDHPDLQDRLMAFLNNTKPLAACAHCLGTSGIKEDHAMLPRKSWQSDLDRSIEDGLDRELMAELLTKRIPQDDCREHQKVRTGLRKARHTIKKALGLRN